MKGTEKYINTSLILRAVMVILKMQAKKIRELLTSIFNIKPYFSYHNNPKAEAF